MSVNISRENMITFLLTTPMFDELEPSEINDILHIVEALKFDPGDIIFSEGESGDAWYALYKGEVDVIKQSGSGEKIIKSLGPHSCFGEIAVLDGLPRSATIRTRKESVALRMPLDKFTDFINNNHLVAYKLIRNMAVILASRQRATTETLSKLLHANEVANIRKTIEDIVGDSSFRE